MEKKDGEMEAILSFLVVGFVFALLLRSDEVFLRVVGAAAFGFGVTPLVLALGRHYLIGAEVAMAPTSLRLILAFIVWVILGLIAYSVTSRPDANLRLQRTP